MEKTQRKKQERSLDDIKKAMEFVKALVPAKAPDGMHLIKGGGLKIMKQETLPSNTIVVSSDLFDAIYSSTEI